MTDAVRALTSSDMAAIAGLVYEQSGIRLTDAKRALVTARLQRHVRAGGFGSFGEYVAHVQRQPNGPECRAMIDALTTNKTSFFREPAHFEFLRNRIVPELLAQGATSITGWSAGCATGEEPYSLAITLLDALPEGHPCTIDILATDLSTTVLAVAHAGVYALDRVANVPLEILRRHFERGVGQDEGRARVLPHVRRVVRFEHANLLGGRPVARRRDFIWCRNTLMYFDQPARQRAVSDLEACLAPHGYFFLSHAENLSGLRHGLVQAGPAIYRRPS